MAGLSKCIGRVSVLLDYYPSAQFAGLHVANRLGLFRKKGLELNLLPPPGAGGDEPALVCNMQRAFDKESGGCAAETPQLVIGTVEQNVLIPAVARGVQSKAFATIFQRSPLALAALPGTKLGSGADLHGKRIGMHVDSIELMCSLMALSSSTAQVVQVQRAQKVQDLISGKVDAIQIYDCMVRQLIRTTSTTLLSTNILFCAQGRHHSDL
jgi:ABC-type nitrate/sulfonate/bicarbonate transport system substrate-binding protein